MFQSLIGTVQPEERVIEVPSDGWFQSLIGTVQLKVRFGSRYHVITRKFQSLIGTVQPEFLKYLRKLRVRVSITHRYGSTCWY